MFARTAWAFPLAWVSTVAAQDPAYHFTMGVTSPAPVPGNPFTFTWTGGDPTGVVYIVLNNYFPDTPNQNIIYGSTDILCERIALRGPVDSPTSSTDVF